LNHIQELKEFSQKEFCFGYPWQEFVYWQLGGVADVDKYYHSKHVYPENLRLLFTAQNRLVLEYISDDLRLSGEDVIDVYKDPLKPENFSLKSILEDYPICDPGFLNQLQQADYVIIPTGSVTNWVALLNNPEVVEILQLHSKQRRLIWLVNPYAQENEVDTQTYLQFFSDRGLKPHLIGNVTDIQDFDSKSYYSYHHLKPNTNNLYNPMEVSQSLQKILTKA
jgi:hypothetical protein